MTMTATAAPDEAATKIGRSSPGCDCFATAPGTAPNSGRFCFATSPLGLFREPSCPAFSLLLLFAAGKDFVIEAEGGNKLLSALLLDVRWI